ncbi:MAG: hypothetical protein R6X05_12030 [Desulfobacterales bacterium]
MTNSTIKHVSFPGPFSHAAGLFGHGSSTVEVAIRQIDESGSIYLGIPFLAGVITRIIGLKTKGEGSAIRSANWGATLGPVRVETGIVNRAERATIRRVGKLLLAITAGGKGAAEILTSPFTGINLHAITGITTRGQSWLKSMSIITTKAEIATLTEASGLLLR